MDIAIVSHCIQYLHWSSIRWIWNKLFVKCSKQTLHYAAHSYHSYYWCACDISLWRFYLVIRGHLCRPFDNRNLTWNVLQPSHSGSCRTKFQRQPGILGKSCWCKRIIWPICCCCIWEPQGNGKYGVVALLGKHEEAIETLSKLRISNQVNVTKEMEAMKEEIKQVKAVTIVEMVTTKSYRNQFIAVVMLYLNLVLVGIDGVVMYSNLMFKEAGLTTSQASIATISVFGAQLLAGVVGSTLVQKYGGRKMLIISNIVIITSLTVCTISRGVPHSKHSATVFVAVGAIGLFLIAWSAGTNPSIFALLAAITTEPTRPTAFGYAALMFWVSDCSVGVGFPFLQKYMGAYSLTPWLAFSVVFLFFSIFFIPETKNKSVKEIQAKFGRSGNEENKPLLNE
ncbi:solute carrier family 2, facilitated glucose transporter member 3-like isoform X2 [Ciona intestinalis]